MTSDLTRTKSPRPAIVGQRDLRNSVIHDQKVDDIKEDETVSSVRKGRFRRSRERNTSDDDRSIRRSNRSRDSDLSPHHVYIKSKFLADMQEGNAKLSFDLRQSLGKTDPAPVTQQTTKSQVHETAQKDQKQRYRRPLTPHKTQKQLYEGPQKLQGTQIQEGWLKQINNKDIEIAQLQNEIEKLRIERDNIKKLAFSYEKEKIKFVTDRNRLESRNTIVEKELENKTSKLLELQNNLLENKQDLAQTRNNLEKLKGMIKENRIAQLEQDNKRLTLQNMEIRKENLIFKQNCDALARQQRKLQSTIQNLNSKIIKLQAQVVAKSKSYQMESMRQQYLNKQIETLRQQLRSGKSSKQNNLQEMIDALTKELFQKKSQIAKANIKLDCMMRRQNELKQQIKGKDQKQSPQYLHLQQLFRKLLADHQKLRNEHNTMKIQMISRNRSADKYSHQIVSSYKDDEITFQLSPEKYD